MNVTHLWLSCLSCFLMICDAFLATWTVINASQRLDSALISEQRPLSCSESVASLEDQLWRDTSSSSSSEMHFTCERGQPPVCFIKRFRINSAFQTKLMCVCVIMSARHRPIYPSINLSIHLSVCLSIILSFCLSIILSIVLPIYHSIYRSAHLSFYLSIVLPIYRSIYLSFCLSIILSFCLPIYISFCLSFYRSFCLSIVLPIYHSICRSIYRSAYLSFCLSIYLSFCLSVRLSIVY